MDELDEPRIFWILEHLNARFRALHREVDPSFASVYYFQTFNLASEAVHLDAATLLLYGPPPTALRIGVRPLYPRVRASIARTPKYQPQPSHDAGIAEG